MENEELIFPIQQIHINLPDSLDLSIESGKEAFFRKNGQLKNLEYLDRNKSQFIKVFKTWPEEQIIYMILLFWWGSPLKTFGFSSRVEKAADRMGWRIKNEETINRMYFKTADHQKMLFAFVSAQQHVAWDALNLQALTMAKMQETLIRYTGDITGSFDQKNVPLFAKAIDSSLPSLVKYQAEICAPVKRTQEDMGKMADTGGFSISEARDMI